MKKKIANFFNTNGINVNVDVYHSGFDIWDYDVYHNDMLIDTFRYFTGKTSNGNMYPNNAKELFADMQLSLKQYLKIN